MTQHTLELHGCTTQNLMSYLKALGIMRVLNTFDRNAKTSWKHHRLVVSQSSQTTTDGFLSQIINEYMPSPVIAPWNGGCGFYKKWDPDKGVFKNREAAEALNAIEHSSTQQFQAYRQSIGATRSALVRVSTTIDLHQDVQRIRDDGAKEGWTAKRLKKEIKEFLNSLLLFENDNESRSLPKVDKDTWLLTLRGTVLDDDAIEWLDAAIVLIPDDKKQRNESPFLGSGGNIGNSDFSNRFMQMLACVLPLTEGETVPETSRILLNAALFGATANGMVSKAVDQFDPGNAGGSNMGAGYDGDSLLNPWDYVLMIEGSLILSGGAAKRLGTTATSSAFPFSVNSSVGCGSANLSDDTRGEIWLPMWHNFVTCTEVRSLFSEGRSQFGGVPARTGVDFAMAVSSLGVDRGISEFVRFQFQKRLGDNYLANRLGTHVVRSNPRASLIHGIREWLDKFRRAATAKHAPSGCRHTLMRIETEIVNLSRSSDVVPLLITLGEAEAAIAISPKLREADYPVPPVPLLDPAWLKEAYDQSATNAREFRLAAALASLGYSPGERVGPVRRHLEPINYDRLTGKSRRAMWAAHADDPSIVWSGGNLVRNLILVLERRLIDAVKSGNEKLVAPFDSRCPALPSDIFHFIEGNVDDNLIKSLMRGLMLIDWNAVKWSDIPWRPSNEHPAPSAAFCLLKLCLLPCAVPTADGAEIDVKLLPQIARRAATGDLAGATELAARRLLASGLRPAVDVITARREIAERTAAALVFPLRHDPKRKRSAVTMLRDRVIRHEQPEESNESTTATAAAP